MLTRYDVLNKAVKECLMELYSLAQPSISWEAFEEENRIFKEKEAEYEALEEKPSYSEFVGPKPFEFYYLPGDVFKEVVDSFVYAYELDHHQQLLDTIQILKDYCNKPIVDKYIEREGDHPDNLVTEIESLLKMYCGDSEADFYGVAQELQKTFFEFLDMAGNFFNWSGDLNTFNWNVYLGASPYSNKQGVIDNWKKYRNQTIEIDESEYDDNEEQDYD
jgi:hypothetical protein